MHADARAEARSTLARLAVDIAGCRACPRLVTAREAAAEGRAERYWSRPVPGFGDPAARIHLLGLATAPHGGNRTGRAFTGNRSADTLVAALHRADLANQATSLHRGDGLTLRDAWMSSAVRCPPPAHRPTRAELHACLGWLTREATALPDLQVVVCLGRTAWEAACDWVGIRPRPRFGHGAELVPGSAPRPALLGCYHPSPQNTATGRLTPSMIDEVLLRARTIAGLPAPERTARRTMVRGCR